MMRERSVALGLLLVVMTPLVLLLFCVYAGHQPAGCGLGGSLLVVIVTAALLAQAPPLGGGRLMPDRASGARLEPLDRLVPPPRL